MTPPFPLSLRVREPEDDLAIEHLLTAAFGSADEARLVHTLRDEGAMHSEGLACDPGGRIVGYAALSAFIAPSGWLALAPVAVQPALQRQGIGSAVVTAVLAEVEAPVVVLGAPEYYGRFGFSVAAAARLTTPYPLNYTGLRGWSEQGDGPAPSETLVYPKSFDAV